jgi:hypothetical protein
MVEERIAIIDLADELQVRKQRIFKILPRLGIRPTRRREQSRGNQNVATIGVQEAAVIRNELLKNAEAPSREINATLNNSGVGFPDDIGVFYLMQLEPNHDPGRFKAGFTVEIEGRFQKHRCSAPFAHCLKTWPCRRTWERAAIDCATDGCERLHTEVFRSAALEEVVPRADAFFAVMPKPVARETEAEEYEQETATNKA